MSQATSQARLLFGLPSLARVDPKASLLVICAGLELCEFRLVNSQA